MTSIARHLPWPIPAIGVSIIGQECYTTLVENLHITDATCLKYSLSKGLGIGIVLGGGIMKVPQIILILRASSARGLSLPSASLETLAYCINTAYAARNHFPFSTYGENAFLSIQNVFITLLIILYTPVFSHTVKQRRQRNLALFGVLVPLGLLTLVWCPLQMLTTLQALSLPLALTSKLPQIIQNQRSRSTGQLSVFAVLAQCLGCAARLFTTATEVKDRLVGAAFGLALVLNLVLGFQLWAFWGREGDEKRGGIVMRRIGVGKFVGQRSVPNTPVPWQNGKRSMDMV
ncbi:hypothetical protein BDQ17DRAFT_369926 [Cyathus striatus]|nr:hypothetical protein BDQ17DRAFT_369926 [Cyathus striatus]